MYWIPAAFPPEWRNAARRGIYQWAKLRFGDLAGFLVALNYWAALVTAVASFIPDLTSTLAYSVGASGAWIAESKPITIAAGALLMGSLILVAVRGLAVGKWIHNAGGFALLLVL